ncbi:hypothetical protein [Chryseobacterium herbae]|uniref:DUF4369 domain-containing protein n=1 Tax=Chryseobacterium herbae TaxID=2976476 RepID=A0ABT2IW74_9FLAO|nr:hypothetical protein [Chryseobacterium sp. pc1-10]MCT2563103.1 hypothetical protein [Chryseobacterium sp. pc1-10]
MNKVAVKKTVLLVSVLFLLIGCSNSTKENEIKVTIKVVDSYTQKPRVNDRVEVRMGAWGFPTRRYVEVGQYFTDSLGTVSMTLDKKERYSFMTFGPQYAFGSDEYKKGELKDQQQVVIKVVPPEKKQFKIEQLRNHSE